MDANDLTRQVNADVTYLRLLPIILLLVGCSPSMLHFSAASPSASSTSESAANSSPHAKPGSASAAASSASANSASAQKTSAGSSAAAVSADPRHPAQLSTAHRENPETVQPKPAAQPLMDEALDYCESSQSLWEAGELDRALDALDKAYSLILEADVDDDAKLLQEKEDLRFTISKRIVEIYASRHVVVNGGHNAIPLDMNRYVEAQIKLLTTSERSFFVDSYRRSGRYRPMIVKALKAAGLPEQLSWLPLIESGFKVDAMSKARALGIWQFISSTGYKFGLVRNTYVDQRLDPKASTMAAVAYLKDLHSIFGDWETSLAAYNCGEWRVLQVIRSQNVNYLDNFWDLYQRLPSETASYVPRFLAVLQILKDPKKYGMTDLTTDPPALFETVTVDRRIRLKDIADAIGCTKSELCSLNPDLRYQVLPDDSYTLRVPPGTGKILLAKLDGIPSCSPPIQPFTYHKIRTGETLSTIARHYHTSVGRIMRANHIQRTNLIRAGHTLKIPLAGSLIAMTEDIVPPKPICPTSVPATGFVHTVTSGDSLWNLALRYHTTTTAIQALNGLQTTNLSIGQRLKIPATCTPAPAQAKPKKKMKRYRVKSGDSPVGIARSHNMSLNQFLRANRLTTKSRIYPGQVLYVE